MNKWKFFGHLGNNATESMSNGNKILNFSVAINRGYYDPAGNWQDKTQWVRVSRFYDLKVDLSSKLEKLKKGVFVIVEGDPTASAYLNNSQQATASLYVIANAIKPIVASTNDKDEN
jgi:single-strand DNA-binding protein